LVIKIFWGKSNTVPKTDIEHKEKKVVGKGGGEGKDV